ncbi:MAG: hypothetical protein IKO79_07300 [Butyrivibrio sp.]|nr:hypothetical protein [Butyrivibrio sp.]
MIFGDSLGVEIFYKYEKLRIVAIGIHLLNNVIMIIYLFLIDKKVNIAYWKYLLVFDLIMFATIILVSAIKVAYTEDGRIFEYNTVISQRKISTVGDDKFDLTLDNDEYEITNGEEIIRMKKLTPYQKEGIKKFVELIREKQNDK